MFFRGVLKKKKLSVVLLQKLADRKPVDPLRGQSVFSIRTVFNLETIGCV